LSKDTEAIQAILTNARRIYDDFTPCDFDEDVHFVNDLYVRYDTPQALRLPQSSPDENREQYRRELDKADVSQNRDEYFEQPHSEKITYSKALSDVIKVNIAMKTLQIMGQVLRNSPGSVPGDVKRAVTSEAYLLGLRTLNALLRIPANNLEGLRRYIAELVLEHRASRNQPALLDSELRKVVDEGVIYLAQVYSQGLIRRVSQAVGLKQLEDIYAEVRSELQDKVPIRLIDLAIRLDHFGSAPVDDIFRLERELRGNCYAHTTLRDLVFTFLYLRQTDYRTRDQLVGRFKFKSGAPGLLENPDKKVRR
jgi:hypothetical protein